ncbi:MAG: hypothetical protein ACI9F2_000744 [Lysobacterales bacterium]|jgi:hypothetical protein
MNIKFSHVTIKNLYLVLPIFVFLSFPCHANSSHEGVPTIKDPAQIIFTEYFGKEVQVILKNKIEKVRTYFTENHKVSNLITTLGQKNINLNQSSINDLDKIWSSSLEIDDIKKKYLINPLAEYLYQFQEKDLTLMEVFVTDARGLIIAMNNVTSDYNQADEHWWQEAYHYGEGGVYISQIEYDESLNAKSIAVSFPVYADNTQEVIGILKCVYSLMAIRIENNL